MAKHLAALGYPGFSYLRTRLRRNPAEVLVGALLQSNLEVRVTEGLPWLVLTYSDLDWEWVLRQVKVHDAQNRLGFLVSLARELATRRGDFATACGLAAVETRLERSRLEHEDTFCHESLTNGEREWLREHRPEQARRWHLLTDLSPEHLNYAS